jgi:soluble lytic murein transglycosylase
MKWFLFSVITLFSAIIICFGFSCYNSYFYPLDYVEVIVSSANRYDVKPELVASIINVESSYDKNAKSNRGAIGLMQIMPSTAEWVCSSLKKEYSEENLYDPIENIQIGTYYLAYLIEYFGNEDLAICAYNAGMGNVKRWLSEVRYSSDGEKLEKIPFKETENYLTRVKKNQKVYKNKF